MPDKPGKEKPAAKSANCGCGCVPLKTKKE